MTNNKTAFVTFFPIIPNNMGSSEVVNSRFFYWPNNKKLFQISHLKNINNKDIETISIKKETPIRKIFKLPNLVYRIRKYLQDAQNKTLIIEGASWIFYSFVIIISFKIILSDCKIIYISHSIESEIRKKYSNKFIYYLTLLLEYLVFKISDLTTSVSSRERKKIKRLYNANSTLFPNGIHINFKRKRNNIKQDYIIFSGSYSYKPNKDAIDFLNKEIMPELTKFNPKIKLVLTGGGYKKKFPWLINKNVVPKNELYNLIHYSKSMCVPLKFGSGTRIKIIEALSLGSVVISSKKGIEGLNLIDKDPPFIYRNKKDLIRLIKLVLSNNKIRKKSNKDKNFYFRKYSMKNMTERFIFKYINK